MITINGNVVAQGSQFSLNDVEVITATVDLEDVRSFRCSPSRGLQAVQARTYEHIEADFSISAESGALNSNIGPSKARAPFFHVPEAEIAYRPACWLVGHAIIGKPCTNVPYWGGVVELRKT